MYRGLIATKDDKIRHEVSMLLTGVGGIKGHFLDGLDTINTKNLFLDYLFILVSDLNHQTLQNISEALRQSPDLSVIFYNHSLNYDAIPGSTHSSKVKLIIGEDRISHLSALLRKLKNDFWRKIPYVKLGVRYEKLSERMKRAMNFIETAPIRDCTILTISDHLNISPGYFSQEFKRETKISFRNFMQTVLDYYEDIIFTKVNLPAKDISLLLGYSELSSFSRSFKKRKGISPTKYRKLLQA